MKRYGFVLAFGGLLAACSGGDGTNPVTSGPSGNTNTNVSLALLPGTTNPSESQGIYRIEDSTGGNPGDGYAQSISYNAATDEFYVDNLAFDGDNAYSRDAAVPNLGPFAVYENDSLFSDPLTGVPISQFPHKAIYARSTNTAGGAPTTEFAVVRTGAYVNYGFGGFLYRRNIGVNLPSSGQANYSGQYAALRDFQNQSGLEYATGDMQASIDFNDFNNGSAITGVVYNRRIFDANGTDITAGMLTALSTEYGGTFVALPSLNFTVGPGVMDRNGEISGDLNSFVLDTSAGLTQFESGKYYGLLAGANADEIVGVIVVEAQDPRATGVTVRETGGFILYRP